MSPDLFYQYFIDLDWTGVDSDIFINIKKLPGTISYCFK
jgi:hypothetical protein